MQHNTGVLYGLGTISTALILAVALFGWAQDGPTAGRVSLSTAALDEPATLPINRSVRVILASPY
jgi:hypothetical protein